MATGMTVRLPDPLKAEATGYAEGLGISLNALLAVALRDYLDRRRSWAEPQPPDLPPLEAYAEDLGREPEPELPEAIAERLDQAEAIPKVGRNDPCPCGSGRKYKVCHGR